MVTFRACLNSPSLDSEGIAELSGFLECSSPEHWQTVELISGKLRAGTKGKVFDAQIDDVSPNWAKEGHKLTLNTSLKPDELRSIEVVTDDGRRSSLSRRTHTLIGKQNIYIFASQDALPAHGKILAKVMTGQQTLNFPFYVTNLTLLGQSRGK